MPDWCENKLYVSGTSFNVERFCRAVKTEVDGMYKKVGPKSKRSTGVCRYWNEDRGFGFLQKDDYSSWIYGYNGDEDEYGDVFVHCSELHANGKKILRKGESVEFDLVKQTGDREKAVNVTGASGSYVRGDNQMDASHNIKLACYGLKQLDPESESTKSESMQECINGQSNLAEAVSSAKAVLTFATKFSPPRSWLLSVTTRQNVSLHLVYGYENPETVGYMTAKSGKITAKFSMEQYTLFEDNRDIFCEVFEDEVQELISQAITKSLVVDIPISVVQRILSFNPRYRLEGVMSLFHEIWGKYAKDVDCAVPRDSVLFGLFSAIDKKLKSVFYENDVEIVDRRSVRFRFWDEEYGLFNDIQNKCLNGVEFDD